LAALESRNWNPPLPKGWAKPSGSQSSRLVETHTRYAALEDPVQLRENAPLVVIPEGADIRDGRGGRTTCAVTVAGEESASPSLARKLKEVKGLPHASASGTKITCPIRLDGRRAPHGPSDTNNVLNPRPVIPSCALPAPGMLLELEVFIG
jgi:hypothetical protein